MTISMFKDFDALFSEIKSKTTHVWKIYIFSVLVDFGRYRFGRELLAQNITSSYMAVEFVTIRSVVNKMIFKASGSGFPVHTGE